MLCKREASKIDRTSARSIFHVCVCINIGLGGRGAFVGWFLFCLCVVLVVCFCFVCFVVDDDGLLDYVQVLHQFSFVALNQQTASCAMP